MAGTRVALDGNHIAAWYFTEAGPTFVNAVNPGTFDMTQANSPKTQAVSPFGLQSGIANEGTNSARHGAVTSNNGPTSATSAITMEFWIYWRATNNTGFTQHWFNKQQTTGVWSGTFAEHGFQNRQFASQPEQWDAFVRTNGTSPSLTMDASMMFPLNDWAHVGFTYDSGVGSNNFNVYLNGDLIGFATGSGAIQYGTGPWFIGAVPAGSGNNEEQASVMADCRVSNIARPASYFRNVYQQGRLAIGGAIVTRYYRLWAKYDNCATPVTWTDTQVSLANAPDNPCSPGTGTLSNPIILHTWEA